MVKLGNIIFENELVNHSEVSFINYIKNPTLSDLESIDKTLPTLYVGWQFLKNYVKFNGEVSVLDKNIIDRFLYWEFSFDENKNESIDGVDDFITNVPEYYFRKKFTYVDLNPVFFSIPDINELFFILPKEIDKGYNYKNKSLYLLKDNKITMIDLSLYEYFGFNIDDIINRIKSITITYINDNESDVYVKYNTALHAFENLKRYIVTLI